MMFRSIDERRYLLVGIRGNGMGSLKIVSDKKDEMHSLSKRSPIWRPDPNFLWIKPLLKTGSKNFLKKGLLNLLKSPLALALPTPFAPLKTLQRIKFFYKAKKLKALIPFKTVVPIWQ